LRAFFRDRGRFSDEASRKKAPAYARSNSLAEIAAGPVIDTLRDFRAITGRSAAIERELLGEQRQ